MPDVVLLVKAIAIGATVAAAVLWLADRAAKWLSGNGAPWTGVYWCWAIGAGVIAASGATDQWPRWPALEDRARFLTLLLPLTVLVETVAVALRSRRVAWSLRPGLAAVATPILLYNTVYLADLNGQGSAEWSLAKAAFVLCGLAILLTALWTSLCALQAKAGAQVVHWLLGVDALATATTVMLSGYFRAGVLGLSLTGAIFGATFVSTLLPQRPTAGGAVGVSVVGIFSIAIMGRFFGVLSSGLMLCLLLAPLLAWAAELPPLRTLSRGWRTSLRVACVVIPLVIVVIVAQRKFTEASAARSPTNRMQTTPTVPAK